MSATPPTTPPEDPAAACPLDRRSALALLAAFGVTAETASAQDAARVNPQAYRVVFENDRVRAVDYVSRPGIGVCGVGRHSHPAHLTIALTPVKAKVVLADGRTIVAQNEAGAVFWEDATTHIVENVGGSGARVVIVEIKDAHWQPSTGLG